MSESRTTTLDPEALQTLRRLAPRLAERAAQFREAVEHTEVALAEAADEQHRRDIVFRFANHYEESKAVGILLGIERDEVRACLTIDGGLSTEDADRAIVAVNALRPARRLRRVLCWSSPRWFPPRVKVLFLASAEDYAVMATAQRILEEGGLPESYNWTVADGRNVFANDYDVIALLLTPKLFESSWVNAALRLGRERMEKDDCLLFTLEVRPHPGNETPTDAIALPRNGEAIGLRPDIDEAWRGAFQELGDFIQIWVVPQLQGHAAPEMLGNGVSENDAPFTARRNVLLIASGLPQYRALRFHLERLKEEKLDDGTIVERGTFARGAWAVTLVESIVKSPDHSAAAIQSAWRSRTPDLVMSVGLAGGLRSNQIGDVVFAHSVHVYTVGTEGQPVTLDNSPAWTAPYKIQQRAYAELRKGDWIQRLPSASLERTPSVLVAPIASTKQHAPHHQLPAIGNKVRAASADVVAMDLSTSWLLESSGQLPEVECVFIRGIADLIDEPIHWSPDLAARNAAAFAMELLAKLSE